MIDRLFFALWPDDRLQASLLDRLPPLTQSSGGRPQRPDQWHVTLEFLGNVESERRPGVVAAAARVDGRAFELCLDMLEHWRRPQVYCLAASRIPTALIDVVDQLRSALRHNGFAPDTREYRPHVTLARKVRRVQHTGAIDAVRWSATRFALVKSVTDVAGSRYEPQQWWNLQRRDD